jgi:hypothetical protein
MENRGLLFIPDISGFSQFVNAVELEHSRFIIQQLLEVLIDTVVTNGASVLETEFGD